MAGEILFLEDREESIQSQLQILSKHGIQYHICMRPRALDDYLYARSSDEPVTAIFLDMHMREIKDLSEINLPTMKTQDGLGVGLAVATGLLRAACSPYRGIPLGLLTGFVLTKAAINRLDELKQQNNEIPIFSKQNDLERFESFIESLKSSPSTPDPRANPSVEEKIRFYHEGIDILVAIANDLDLTDEDKITLLGYDPLINPDFENLYSKLRADVSTDVNDRVALLIDLKSSLAAIFNDNIRLERRWLRAPLDVLDGQRPLDLIRTQHIDQLARVAGLLRSVTD